MIDIVIY